ncbi:MULTISPECIES: hypothetical protein [unclassified Rhizobium]|uniref:hypothetical protein n=1 Tax=unclassified Rhizobium TaxID=2613769 RepID=UPI000EA9051F|nr:MULTISPECIES: hypothetical protein [unclassified Rhizobium]AYG66015.1 hypothetical protein CCGE531_08420 [Rhizobium sp. CCGE531]AYG72500.1 hypothetical protein CCGE532_08440 [Rhizobium sp. CCGE532]
MTRGRGCISIDGFSLNFRPSLSFAISGCEYENHPLDLETFGGGWSPAWTFIILICVDALHFVV